MKYHLRKFRAHQATPGDVMTPSRSTYLGSSAALGTAVALWLLALLVAPIARPLAWALIIGISTLPLHDRLSCRFPQHPNRCAALMVLAITVCLILPIIGLIVLIVENAVVWYSEGVRLFLLFTTTGVDTIKQLPFTGTLITLSNRFNITPANLMAKLTNSVSAYLFDLTTNTAIHFGEIIFTGALTLFILFFVYRDGKRIVERAIDRCATNRDRARHYASEIRATTTAVTVGTLFTCLAQGVTAAIGYYFAGVPAPVICGALTAVAAVIPVIGTGILWVPLTLLLLLNGFYLKGILLALWCVIFVGLADNAIRPLAIKAKGNICVPAIVLGAVCGVYVLGSLGLILGPVLFAILITVWGDIMATDHHHAAEKSHI